MVVATTLKDLKPVLMEPGTQGIKEPFYLIQTKSQTIFVVSPGKNGCEFNKTNGFFNNFPEVTNYQCLFGQGLILMQRNDSFGEAKEFKVISLSPGRQVEVPAGWGICLVNTGMNLLVVLQNSILDKKYIDSQQITDKQGLAYYIIEKKGEVGFASNPRYKLHPQIATE